jgi:uncharacterized membrane protein YkvA (DUF1232 family)
MTTKYVDFKEWMTTELIDFIQSRASALSVADLNRLIADLPALRERFTTIPSQTYPYLSDQLQFLSRVFKDEVTGSNRDPISQTVSEAAFALLYFQTATDLIPDSIPDMGLLDDAIIASLVLRRMRTRSNVVRTHTSYTGRFPLLTSINCSRLSRHSGRIRFTRRRSIFTVLLTGRTAASAKRPLSAPAWLWNILRRFT